LKATIDLSKFEANVTAAKDHEMCGEDIDIHHRAVGQVRNLVEAGHRWNRDLRANIDKDLIGR
jgi:hypothetical protein